MKQITLLYLAAIALLTSLSACTKKFDDRFAKSDTDNFYYQTSIAELLEKRSSKPDKAIEENLLISGTVIADDRSGNFYKQIIIDDGTAAIPILLDAYNIYTRYGGGRKVWVKCKGLAVHYAYKLPQLGYDPNGKGGINGIPVLLWDDYLIAGEKGDSVKPIKVSIAEAKKALPELYNRLIELTEAQIDDTANALRFAVSEDLSSATNINLTDCAKNKIILRTSAYAVFAQQKPSALKGSIRAIYTVYNNTPQLVLRDTADIHFTEQRCF